MNRKLFGLLATVLVVLMGIAPAMADGINQEIYLNVKRGNLEVPGHILGPGKYDLRFVGMEHDFVDLRTAAGDQIGFYEVVPITRATRKDKVKLVLTDQKPSSAELKEFFYPGMKTGYKIMYPQTHARTIAKVQTNSSSQVR